MIWYLFTIQMDLAESAEAIQAVWTGKDVRKSFSMLAQSLPITHGLIFCIGDSDCSVGQVYQWPE